MADEYKSSVTRNPYTPSVLPEWRNECINADKQDQQRSKVIQLTDENASNYSGITSHVGWKRRVNYAIKSLENSNDSEQDSSSILTSLLENVISTVILLASDGNLPDEYLINSYLYLRNIHNEFGENPPNIKGFLELLKTKASQEILSILSSIDKPDMEDLPPNLRITRIPKSQH